jgi:fermentation-respiration switch protein FrsA (DUF1100 family)
MQNNSKKSKWSVRGVLIMIAVFTFLLYMVIPCFLWSPIFNQIVVLPSPADPKAYEFAVAHSKNKPKDCLFTNKNGDTLHGWFYANPAAKKLVLIHHGNAGNISSRFQLPDFLHDCGAAVFMYDYRGYGKSTGTPTVATLIEDGYAATSYATDKLGFRPEQIIHYGESIGSGVACDVAAQQKCAGLVFHSGLSSLPSEGRRVFAFLRPYPDFLFPHPQMQNAQNVRKVHAPVLVIAAIPDQVVSYHEGETVYANAAEPKELVLLKLSQHNCTVGEDCNLVDTAMRKFIQSSI